MYKDTKQISRPSLESNRCVNRLAHTETSTSSTGEWPVIARYQFSPPRVQLMHTCWLHFMYVIFQKSVYCTSECMNTCICTDIHAIAMRMVARSGTRRELVARQYVLALYDLICSAIGYRTRVIEITYALCLRTYDARICFLHDLLIIKLKHIICDTTAASAFSVPTV
jgi:hypothetical protein